MSDSAVLAGITITQSDRFYYWRVQQFPTPRREIETSSANMHMIPADPVVLRQLRDVRLGEGVDIQGFSSTPPVQTAGTGTLRSPARTRAPAHVSWCQPAVEFQGRAFDGVTAALLRLRSHPSGHTRQCR